MNTRIFALLAKNLNDAFHLDKYEEIRMNINKGTIIDNLPWTPARRRKFDENIANELYFETVDLSGTVEESVNRLDIRYMNRFFGEIWQPETDKYQYSGWGIVDTINNQNPVAVLDCTTTELESLLLLVESK